ncbi:MAG: ABC transporter ATP-binding protein [Nitrososphaerota archaeon]|jgi:simple sugar transport system ATP-binding protein|nr:ABC transporter ATP-binding protein [Nitrososphaerota archaeon]MDG6930232.1 ABC transporter ATP-binding protein [Nitrososphaerota archaeon]MDG6932644.1 ABC transporter ATP-binding protein [Nitrososphaerota archaeon]MDG6935564.1 ABC transporter ATP-binding protein [Nitrososphaerota archaeon]MDG6944008.1 ABC transporter ATP-binding protein [Nitrososphaerota archaeon]
MEPYIKMLNIRKEFPGVTANDNINLEIYGGEIHALLGENGAGKTTLMNILYGLYRPTSGEIIIDGKEVKIGSPTHALAIGIGMVHQHFSLIPYFTVAENIAIGLKEGGFKLNLGRISSMISDAAAKYGLGVNPGEIVGRLSMGEKQRVEIVKMLIRGVKVLILDEPTSSLTPQEAEQLFNNLRTMVNEGKSVILITHKLYEVLEVADRVTVLRKGRVVYNGIKGELSSGRLVEAMVGREVQLDTFNRVAVKPEGALEVKDLTVLGDSSANAVNGVSIRVNGGEIYGIAGVAGNGQRELTEAIFGVRKAVKGSVSLNGKKIDGSNVRGRIRAGLGLIPEERIGVGVIPEMPLYLNSIVHDHWWKPYSANGFFSYRQIRAFSKNIIDKFQVAAPSENSRAGHLSGGNIQKFIVGRSMLRGSKYLIAVNPTSGLDVGATEAVRNSIVEFRNSGGGVLLVSEDLDELLAMCDRIGVMYKGKIMKEFESANFDKLKIGSIMMGENYS